MKLHSLTIENFRSFDHFTLKNLGRVNLLVGTNNSGKTSVLEAADILTSNQKLSAIWETLIRRGEAYDQGSPLNEPLRRAVDLRCLFHKHVLRLGSRFRIAARTDLGPFEMMASIQAAGSSGGVGAGQLWLNGDFSADHVTRKTLSLIWDHGSWDPEPPLRGIPLDRAGGLSRKVYRRQQDDLEWSSLGANKPSFQFLSTSALTDRLVARLYDEVVLTPNEERIVDSLKILDPRIERLASVGSERGRSILAPRGGIVVRLAGSQERIPIGSMGDGIWRMLGLALAVVHSQNKILLIDEVDTGLHYSVMGKMWRFLNECSQRFNVQIIATTHSRDCYQSLAEICRVDVVDQSEVTIQRIDRKRAEAVVYSEAAIIAVADRDLEVR